MLELDLLVQLRSQCFELMDGFYIVGTGPISHKVSSILRLGGLESGDVSWKDALRIIDNAISEASKTTTDQEYDSNDFEMHCTIESSLVELADDAPRSLLNVTALTAESVEFDLDCWDPIILEAVVSNNQRDWPLILDEDHYSIAQTLSKDRLTLLAYLAGNINHKKSGASQRKEEASSSPTDMVEILTKEKTTWNKLIHHLELQLGRNLRPFELRVSQLHKGDSSPCYHRGSKPITGRVLENSAAVYRFEIDPMLGDVDQSNNIKVSDIVPELFVDLFSEITSFNPVQSAVLPAIIGSNKNVLVSAPTGVGKTYMALASIVRSLIYHPAKKIVYVAPFKALVNEITAGFQRAFGANSSGRKNYKVASVTSDTPLTNQEIREIDIIVTVPEKFDVQTRNNIGLLDYVDLVILDEVHILGQDRGYVLESLISRFKLRAAHGYPVPRIVALSATLPNFGDVAHWLECDHVFNFDGSYRPVPLALQIVGFNQNTQRAILESRFLDEVFDICHDFKSKNMQSIVFVWSRNDCFETAFELVKRAPSNDFFRFDDVQDMHKQVGKIGNSKFAKLALLGIGVHNAGLSFHDRKISERLFRTKKISVLVSTSTLAWGVNLPAAAVIVKGTDLYSKLTRSSKDVSILDVLQMFGRAGRPQYEIPGRGVLITTIPKVDSYVSKLCLTVPLASCLEKNLREILLSEICLGHCTDYESVVAYLKTTYWFVLNPKINLNEIAYKIVRQLVIGGFIGSRETPFSITQLGSILVRYYLSVDQATTLWTHEMAQDEYGVLTTVFSVFEDISYTEEDNPEIIQIMNKCYAATIVARVKNVVVKKALALFAAWLNKIELQVHSMTADIPLVMNSAARLLCAFRDMLLISPYATDGTIGFSNQLAILAQKELPFNTFDEHIISATRVRPCPQPDSLWNSMSAPKDPHLLRKVKFPTVDLVLIVEPIMDGVVAIKGRITEVSHLRHHDKIIISVCANHGVQRCIVRSEPGPIYLVCAVDIKSCSAIEVTVRNYSHIRPYFSAIIDYTAPSTKLCKSIATPLLRLKPLPVTAAGKYSCLFRKFKYFNPIQSQLFWPLYHSDQNIFAGAPTGSGKTVLAELGIARSLTKGLKAVYLAPMKSLLSERVQDWSKKFRTGEFSGDTILTISDIYSYELLCMTPEKFDDLSRKMTSLNRIGLIILDELQLLGSTRGAVLESIVYRAKKWNIRLIALSTYAANPIDVLRWLNVEASGAFNFLPSLRSVPCALSIKGFANAHYCPRMNDMNATVINLVKERNDGRPMLIFVSSRRQVLATAYAIIGHCSSYTNSTTDREETRIRNPGSTFLLPGTLNRTFADTGLCQRLPAVNEGATFGTVVGCLESEVALCFKAGVAIHHAGMSRASRYAAELAFREGFTPILVATSTLAWGVNLPAHYVVIKGGEYWQNGRYVDYSITEMMQMVGRAGRPQFDEYCSATLLVREEVKHYYKRFMFVGFPIESALVSALPDALAGEIVTGSIKNKLDAVEFLAGTFFFQRLRYSFDDPKNLANVISTIIEASLRRIQALGAISLTLTDGNLLYHPTLLGQLCVRHYLKTESLCRLYTGLNANDLTISDILTVCCNVPEAEAVPVRHNEPETNEAWAKSLPISHSNYPWSDGKSKALLLVQSHIMDLTLPVPDYDADRVIFIKTFIRTLNCAIDIVSHLNRLSYLFVLISIRQAVHTRRLGEMSLTGNNVFAARENSLPPSALSINNNLITLKIAAPTVWMGSLENDVVVGYTVVQYKNNKLVSRCEYTSKSRPITAISDCQIEVFSTIALLRHSIYK